MFSWCEWGIRLPSLDECLVIPFFFRLNSLSSSVISAEIAKEKQTGSSLHFRWWNRELTLKCKLKCYVKPMKDPLGVSPSKGNLGTARGKEKFFLPRWEANPRPPD